MLKKLLRKLVSVIFNSLPSWTIQSIVNGRLRPIMFRHYLNPDKEVIIRLRNEFFTNQQLSVKGMFPIERQLLTTGVYDYASLKLLQQIIGPDDRVIDVGANIGSIAIPIANFIKPSGKIYAFEPGDETFDRLQRNVNLNADLTDVLIPVNLGLSNKTEEKYWKEDQLNRGNASFNDTEGTIKKLITLDSFLAQTDVTKIDFIKIDVEGMELEVLEGAKISIIYHKPIIYFESWVGLSKLNDQKLLDIEKFLTSESYCLYSYDPHLNKLEKVKFPHFKQNTLAMHSSKLTSIKNLVM